MAAKRKATFAKLGPLIAEVRSLIQSARHTAASTINTLQVLTNFEIGRRIVEHEQKGKKRAGYGQELLKELSTRLTEEFGRGFSVSNLRFIRQFHLDYRHRIQQTVSGELTAAHKHLIPHNQSGLIRIHQTPSGKSQKPQGGAQAQAAGVGR